MAKTIKRFDNFSFGVVDKKFLARSDLKLREQGFESSSNVWVSNSGSLIARPGTKLVKDFGDGAVIKGFTFARGQNQQYLLVFSQGTQQIYYIDQKGFLVEASQDEVEQSLVPQNLTSNTSNGFNIVSTLTNANAFHIFDNTGISDANVYTVDITFPNPITFFRAVMDIGSAAVIQGTFYKSTGESWTATAGTPLTTYTRTSCGGSSCRTTTFSGNTNMSQYTFEFPAGAFQYNDIKRMVLTFKRYVSQTTGNFPQSYTSTYVLANGFIKKLAIMGTTSSGTGAVWHEDIPVDKISQASYDFTNRYLFFAQKDIKPYVVSVFGAFTFAPLVPIFPTTGEVYNFTTMGYPDVVCCGQSRLWYAGFEKETTSIIGSKVGYNLTDLQNFNPTVVNNIVLPSSAVKFQPTDIRNKINWAVAASSLNFASWDGIFKMTYGNDQPISATGAVVLKQNEEASSRVFPAWYNGLLCFASMGRDELRLMDFNLYRQRQVSINISQFSNDLNSKKIKKVLFKKDNNANMYVLYDDGTAALVKVIDGKAAGFFPFSCLNGIQDILMGKGDNGERTYLVVTNGTKTQLLLMDEIDYPKMPVVDYNDLEESMENVSEWLFDKAVLDAKVYVKHQLDFQPAFTASQLQTTNPSSVNNLIETYPKWVALGKPPYGELNWSAYVGQRLFFEDTSTHKNFSIDIYSMPKTDGTGGTFIFAVPTDPDLLIWHNNIGEIVAGNALYAWDYLSGGATLPSRVYTTSPTPIQGSLIYNADGTAITVISGNNYTNAVEGFSGSTLFVNSWIQGFPINGLSRINYSRNVPADIPATDPYIWAVEAFIGFVGIQNITLAYNAQEFALFSTERFLGKFCGSAVCGNELNTITLDEPAPMVCYGVPYDCQFRIGYIMNDAAYARRLISTISINTANSWGLKIGTSTNNVLQEAYYAMLLDLPFKKEAIQTLVDMYRNDGNIFGLTPTPMKPFIQMKIEDKWSEYKALIVQQTIPYPFEIFSIEATLEENNSERGQ